MPSHIFKGLVSIFVLALIGFFALYMSSHAETGTIYWAGIAVFVVCVLAAFFVTARLTPHGAPEVKYGSATKKRP